MSKTLIDLVFSDIYLLENPRDCRYKESSDALRLREFETPLHEELSKLYRYLGAQCDATTPGSMTALWPDVSKDTPQSAMRLRVTNLVGSNDQTVFYIRRYRQGVASLADLGVPKPVIDRLLSPVLTQGLCMLGAGRALVKRLWPIARLWRA